MHRVIVVSIVLGLMMSCSGMDITCCATKENIINFYGIQTLNNTKKRKSKEYVFSTAQGKTHYQLLDAVLSYPQTSRTLSRFKSYLDQYNLPIDCPVQGTTSLLDMYITHGIATGELSPLLQYLRLGADPEYSLTNVTPVDLADALQSIHEKRACFIKCLLLIYIGRKYQTKK